MKSAGILVSLWTCSVLMSLAIVAMAVSTKSVSILPNQSAVLRLYDNSDEFRCTVVVVSDIYALTAGHCTRLGEELKFFNEEKKDTGGRGKTVYGRDIGRGDIAVMMGDYKLFKKKPVVTDWHDVERIINDEYAVLYSSGYPYNGPLLTERISLQYLSQFSLEGHGVLFPGMSGGPVYDARTDTVIAINSAAQEEYRVLVSPTINIFSDIKINSEAAK